ncbi:hypothetical protein EN813_046450 [Mesorhizobium sp. M00.F.Ca.ET.170.01.1.1]|nr:hypothetical protein EN813_046450 [Mesorhizobium sp. M00.F.Ca.ET.170.01.1.1]
MSKRLLSNNASAPGTEGSGQILRHTCVQESDACPKDKPASPIGKSHGLKPWPSGALLRPCYPRMQGAAGVPKRPIVKPPP